MAEGIGIAVVSEVASKVAASLFDPIKREISYVFKYQNYIDGFKSQVNDLENKRERVEQQVNHAKRQGDEIHKDVEDWLKRADDFTENFVKPITVGNEDEAKRRCFKGLCPNWFKRYSLSKKAAKATKEGADLLGRGNFSTVGLRRPLEKTELVHVRGHEQFDSRLKVFQDVMETLNDSNVDMIGVYGMGGVGKTTLVKQVAKKVIEVKLFDEVIMAEVTQTPDHKTIQDKIARDLGLEFGLHESVFQRADRLRVRLKKEKRVLVILDNIWTKLELDAVGIPFRGDENQRKDDKRRFTIILTSRTRDLLCNDMNSLKNFLVEVLSKEEAEQLFEKIVGDSAKQSDFQPLACEIVRRCGGLPVALITIANALKTKDLSFWKDALNQLRNFYPREIHGMDANVYSSIKLSYNFLESEEAKYLFLLCGLHQAGDSINVLALMRYGMGLGLFKNVYTLETARNRVHGLIDSLKVSCLLLDGDTEDEVKMHDIIHVVAVSIASEKSMFNIQNVADLKDETKIKGSTAISVHYRDIQELPERLECPQLKLFLLSSKCDSLQISDLYFEGMKQLKVLNFTEFCFPSLPSSLGCLINLQTLCFDSCRLENTAIVGHLKKLEILSFRGSDIEQLPVEIGQLTLLRLLDLSNCESLKVIAPNVISKLSRLEELYMGDSFTQWEKAEGCGNSSLVELKELSKLTTLDICIPDVEIIPQDLVSVKLERYWICVGDLPHRYDYDIYKTSRFLKLDGLEKSILLGNYRMKLLKRTEDLYLEELKGFQNVVHDLDNGEGFPQLKHLHVTNCSEILHIVSSVGQVHDKVFPLLESLFLDNLINLEKVCHNQLTEDQSFSNLRIIKVKQCVKLKQLFSFSMAKILLRLQKIEVSNCNNLEMIVGPDMEKPTTTLGFKEIISEDDSLEKVIFPSLKELQLESLIAIENIWLNQFRGTSTSICCQNLTKVTLWYCNGVKYLFSYSMVNSLVQLEYLYIHSCESMEAVVIDNTSTRLGRDERKFIEMVFPKLNYLSLSCLPKLTSFAIHSVDNNLTEMQPQPLFDENVALPSLMTLHVSSCDGLRNLMTFSTAESMVKLTRMEISLCEKMEQIIQEVGEEVKEDQVCVFSQLEYLELTYLHSLTSFCLGNYTLEFSSLEQISVWECQNMKTFSQGVSLTPKLHKVTYYDEEWYWEGNLNSTIQKTFKEMVGFRGIDYFTLSKFPYLQEKWHSQELHVSMFNNLIWLKVDDCTDMSSAISLNLLRCLNNLKWLTVSNCDSLEEVFHLEEPNVDEHFGPLLPKLKSIELIDLPKLQRFCNFTGNIIELPSLHLMRIENCPNMEVFVSISTSVYMTANKKSQEMTSEENFSVADIQHFFDEKVAIPRLKELNLFKMPKLLYLQKERLECSKLAQSWVSFENLTTLEISDCEGMRSLMTLSTAESMLKLTIREMTQQAREEVKMDIGIVFVHLKYLKLDRLPSLTCFCVGNYTLEFPSFVQVLVRFPL